MGVKIRSAAADLKKVAIAIMIFSACGGFFMWEGLLVAGSTAPDILTAVLLQARTHIPAWCRLFRQQALASTSWITPHMMIAVQHRSVKHAVDTTYNLNWCQFGLIDVACTWMVTV